MAWVKVPPEHHAMLLAALPRDPRVRTVMMFGSTVALVNGHLFGGVFARSAIVRLGEDDRREALALDGAQLFDPIGKGRVMTDTVLLPESVMDEPEELRQWLARAFAHASTLPPKQKRAKPRGTKPASPRGKKPASKRVTKRVTRSTSRRRG